MAVVCIAKLHHSRTRLRFPRKTNTTLVRELPVPRKCCELLITFSKPDLSCERGRKNKQWSLNRSLAWLPVASCGWLWLLFVLQNCTTLTQDLDFPKKQAPLSCESSRSRANAVNYQSLFQNRSFRAKAVEKTNSAAVNTCLGWLPVASCGWLWLLSVLQNCTTRTRA